MEVQLDLFEKDETVLLRREIAELRASMGNLRRGLFARHNELANKYVALRMDYEWLALDMARLRHEIGEESEVIHSLEAI